MDRKQLRAARRADRDGSGPTLDEREPARFPGAAAKLALFGEVLMAGMLITLVSLPIVTLPIALAAGIRHLRRYVLAEGSPLSEFWLDVRRGLAGGILVGLGASALAAILAFDILLARSGALPGGAAIEVIGWAGLAAVGAAVFGLAGLWSPELGWRGAVRALPASIGADLLGALYLVAAAVFVGVLTWALLPLVIPAIGCAALAVVAIPVRPRRRAAH